MCGGDVLVGTEEAAGERDVLYYEDLLYFCWQYLIIFDFTTSFVLYLIGLIVIYIWYE